MNLPISGVGAFIDFLVLAFFYFKLTRTDLTKNSLMSFFKGFTLYFSLFYLCFSLPILFMSANSGLIGAGYLVGHVLAYIAFGYLARIYLLIAAPAFDSRVIFKLYLILGTALTLLNLYFFNYPVVLENGITQWNQNPLVGVLIILTGMTVFLPAAIVFIRNSFKNKEERKRYFLIGLAFVTIILGGPLHDVAKTQFMSLLADTVTTIGFIFMFIGVLLKPKKSSAKARVE